MAKYGNEKVRSDGYKFDSKVEMKYYEKLKIDKAKELILNFELQPRFELMPSFKRHGKSYRKTEYVGDFLIYRLDGSQCVIDIKGMATETAKLKKKLFEHLHINDGLELWWLVWSGGQWLNYDDVIKASGKRKKAKNDK